MRLGHAEHILLGLLQLLELLDSFYLQILPGDRKFRPGRRKNDSASGVGLWLIGDNSVLCLRDRVGYSNSNLIHSERLRLDSRL